MFQRQMSPRRREMLGHAVQLHPLDLGDEELVEPGPRDALVGVEQRKLRPMRLEVRQEERRLALHQAVQLVQHGIGLVRAAQLPKRLLVHDDHAQPPLHLVFGDHSRPRALDALQRLVQAVALVGLTRATDGIKLSLDDLVTELERTTRQELDFCVEQHNLVRFRQFLDDQPGVESPRPYQHLSSDDVLVMDFVEGPMINDVPALRAMGLDPAKLGQRLAESFVTQIVDNGFFHADPHPGNILVRGDDIVWIDLGMVGQLSALERALIGRMFRAVAENDPYALMEALLGAVRSEGPVNHGRLLSQLGNLLVSYTTVNLADINVGSALMDVFGVLQTQNLALPPSFTLLARGMVTIEGVLVDIAPDTSVIDIIAAHVKRRERTWEAFETKAREFVSTAATSAQAAVRLPTQASHTLDMIDRGQVRVGADLGIPIDAIAALYSVSGTVAMALISAGLFIGSSLLATTNMHPQFLGVPLLGVLGYVGAFVLGAYVVWRNLVIRHRQKNEEKL